MFCHGNDKGYLSFYSFFNGLGRLISRHVDCRRIWFCYLLSLEPVNRSIDYQYGVLRTTVVNPHTMRTDGNIGSPRCSPSTPGFTPPTILVPHSNDSFAFAVALDQELAADNWIWRN